MSVQPPPIPGAAHALLIEDDAHSLFAISLILRDLGVQFKRNTTGATACEQAAAMQPVPHFILLDLHLPGTEALTLLRRLRHQPATRSLPIIAMTDHTNGDRGTAALNGGAFAVLNKPFSRRQLADVLHALPAPPAPPSTPADAASAPVSQEG